MLKSNLNARYLNSEPRLVRLTMCSNPVQYAMLTVQWVGGNAKITLHILCLNLVGWWNAQITTYAQYLNFAYQWSWWEV
jgi:hypothetical protein